MVILLLGVDQKIVGNFLFFFEIEPILVLGFALLVSTD